MRLARAHGMRVVGPNSFGMVNNDPEVRLNASLAPQLPPPGRLGLFSQSGALGIAVLAGVVIGLFVHQPTIGFLGGLAVGVAAAVAVWLIDRR